MALNKSDIFTLKDQQLALLAKALSHPARIAILKVLATKNECVCGDIVLEIPLAQSTVSQHLKELKTAGLITGSIDGVKSCYCINRAMLKKFNQSISQLFESITDKLKCC